MTHFRIIGEIGVDIVNDSIVVPNGVWETNKEIIPARSQPSK